MNEKILAMMQDHQVVPPDTSDVEDVRRALLQLRERLVVEYRHVASLGRLPEQVRLPADDERAINPAAPDDEARNFRLKTLKSLARPNRARRGSRSESRRTARRNPLSPDAVEQAIRYASAADVEPDAVPGLREALSKQRKDAMTQPLSRGVVEAMFPREGKLRPDSWAPAQRFPEALGRYDLVTRLGEVGPPPPDADPDRPFTNKAALDYVMDAAGMSLTEARNLLAFMRTSAENKGPGGGDKAMQPSSAMCKASRTRKVRGYKMPRELAAKTGFDSVVILLSPVGQQPRVMTFRHGTHIDCDLVGSDPNQVLPLLGRALQVSLYWLAERAKRLERTHVYAARIGDPEVYLVWKPGNPISLQAAMNSIQGGATFRYTASAGDTTEYVRAVKATFGTENVGPVSRMRTATTPPPSKKSASRPEPEVPVDVEVPAASWDMDIVDVES